MENRIVLNGRTARRVLSILEQQQRLQLALQQIELTARELLGVPEGWRLVREGDEFAFVESVVEEDGDDELLRTAGPDQA